MFLEKLGRVGESLLIAFTFSVEHTLNSNVTEPQSFSLLKWIILTQVNMWLVSSSFYLPDCINFLLGPAQYKIMWHNKS